MLKNKTSYFIPSVIALPILVCTFFAVSFQSVFAGYGYGYGYGDCQVSAPQNLTVQKNIRQRTIKLQWEAVNFSSCHTTVQRYHVQIDKNNTTIRQYTTTTPSLMLKYSNLSGAGTYRYRVYAEAANGAVTEWSSYKYFTL